MTKDQKRTFWKQHFEDWQKSGIKQPDYCKLHNISIASFRLWRTRLRREANPETRSAKKLVPVAITKASNLIQLSLPSGIQMNIPVHLLAETLEIIGRNQSALAQ